MSITFCGVWFMLVRWKALIDVPLMLCRSVICADASASWSSSFLGSDSWGVPKSSAFLRFDEIDGKELLAPVAEHKKF